MAKLSVCVVTNRVGGFDVLRAGLESQSYRDFELVLVDAIGDRRDFPSSSFAVKHLGPEPGPRWGNYMRSMNRALEAATGERLVFWSDYTCAGANVLSDFVAWHEEDPEAVHLGDIDYVRLPALHPEFPIRYGWLAMGYDQGGSSESYAPYENENRRHALYEEWRRAYERDLDAGALDACMQSAFANPFGQATEAVLLPNGRQSRALNPHLNLKNDSIPRPLLQRAGGFDERADGTHGHQDTILMRNLLRFGMRMVPTPGTPVRLLDPHNLMIIRRMDRPDTANLSLAESYA